jgi:HEAT repeat protein
MLVLATLAAAMAFPAYAQSDHSQLADRLKTAFRETDEQARYEAVEAAAGVQDPDVIAGVARGLRDRSLAVRRSAVRALGQTQHPDALKALHSLYKSDQGLRKDEALFALLTKEIGRHGDLSSLPVLRDKPFKGLTKEVGRARLMAASRIRSMDVVEAIFEGARKGGGTARGRGGKRFRDSGYAGIFWEDFRVAIAVLTGHDPGRDKDEALKWWQDNKKSVTVPEKRPEIPEPLTVRWEEYWQEPYYAGRDKPKAEPLGAPHRRTENPDDRTVELAVDGLKEGLKSKDPEERAAAIETFGYVQSDKVSRAVAKALRDREDRVRLEAIEALGWATDKDALRQLHRLYQRDKKLRSDETVFTALLKAIGRHGDDSSVKVLIDSPFKGLTIATGQARIYGLGNIRSNDSVEELIKAMRLGGGETRGGRSPANTRFMIDMRVALYVLTGLDHGTSKEVWQGWWRDNKKKFKVSPERPNVPDSIKSDWQTFWNEAY